MEIKEGLLFDKKYLFVYNISDTLSRETLNPQT